jgi:putative RecB family exonuclease
MVTAGGHNGDVSSYLSPSAAALWKQCPRKWWFRYVDRLPEPPPGEPAVLGSFVHAVLERLLDHDADERTPELARTIARAEFDEFEHRGDYRALGFDDAGARRFRQRAWTTIETYFEEFQPTTVVPVAQELSLNVEVAGVPFRGFIDLVERDGRNAAAVVVTDYKTGKPPDTTKPWSDEQNRERLLQPLWYAAALIELGEHTPSLARLLYFTAVDTPSGGFAGRTGTLAVDVDPEVLESARNELALRWREIGEARALGSAEARPGPLCGWCAFVEHCEEGATHCRAMRAEVNPRTGEPRLRDDAPAVQLLGMA